MLTLVAGEGIIYTKDIGNYIHIITTKIYYSDVTQLDIQI